MSKSLENNNLNMRNHFAPITRTNVTQAYKTRYPFNNLKFSNSHFLEINFNYKYC